MGGPPRATSAFYSVKLCSSSGIFTTGFSVHDLVFGIRKVSSRTNRKPKLIKSRQLKIYDPVKFRKDLQQVDWETIIQIKNIHKIWQKWEKQFTSTLDKHAPYRQRKVKNSYTPYIDKEVRHKIF